MFFVLGIFVVIGYSLVALTGFVRGPRITLESPRNGVGATMPLAIVSGRVLHASSLAINGATTPLNLAGDFSKQLLLAEGYNIISVEATDRYGRTTKEERKLILRTDTIPN